jgi:hypothetical protein
LIGIPAIAKRAILLLLLLGSMGALLWASDRITLQGERTIYTVGCEQGVWDGLRCTGRMVASKRYRFRASPSRGEVIYWIVAAPAPSGKYAGCDVKNRDNWTCPANTGEYPSITHTMALGRPIPEEGAPVAPYYAIAKWKWWLLDAGIPAFAQADY